MRNFIYLKQWICLCTLILFSFAMSPLNAYESDDSDYPDYREREYNNYPRYQEKPKPRPQLNPGELLPNPRAKNQPVPKAKPVDASTNTRIPGNNSDKAPANANATQKLKPIDAYEKVYVYAYPLVLFDFTKRIMTNASEPDSVKMRAPINQFIHVKTLPDASNKEILRANLDTLYSSAFLDVSKEPMVLVLPKSKDRYYVMQLLDAWTEVFNSQGTRTSPNDSKNLLITGPHWTGKLPRNLEQIKSPTDFVWLLGKTQINGKDDYEKVYELQSAYKLIPLSAWDKDYTPPKDVPTKKNVNTTLSALDQVDEMDDIYFLTTFVGLLRNNPPHPDDQDMIALLKSLGIFPGQGFDATKLTPAQISEIGNGFRKAKQTISANVKKYETLKDNWNVITQDIGRYGNNYLDRATIALIALGANLPEDGISPTTFVDTQGRALNAGYKYVMHFDKENLPPTNAFWSIVLYDDKNLLIPNILNRFILGNRDPLKYNPDGSLDIYLQNTSPGTDKESNWLPTPPYGGFNVTLRLYAPKPEAINGSWRFPSITPQGAATRTRQPQEMMGEQQRRDNFQGPSMRSRSNRPPERDYINESW